MKKVSYLYFVFSISITLIYSVTNLASAQQSIPSLIKKVQPAVVLIIAQDTIGNTANLGSGFFISQKGEIVTNWHVVRKPV